MTDPRFVLTEDAGQHVLTDTKHQEIVKTWGYKPSAPELRKHIRRVTTTEKFDRDAEHIVKVQRALSPMNAPYLIYDEHRHATGTIPQHEMPHQIREMFRTTGALKMYFRAKLEGSQWRLIARVGEEPSW